MTSDRTELTLVETKELQQLYQPKCILERLALPSPKDFESLLQDSSKPALSLRCDGDPLPSGKQTTLRVSLPPLSWSYYSAHNKPSSDLAKGSGPNSCHAKWVRMEGRARFLGGRNCPLLDLESLIFNENFVPLGSIKYVFPEIGNDAWESARASGSMQPLSSANAPEASCSVPVPAPSSPRSLLAAQTLYDMVNQSFKHPIPSGTVKSHKQPSQKSMKAHRSKTTENFEHLSLAAKVKTVLNDPPRSMDHINMSKKAKLSVADKKDCFTPLNAPLRGQNSYWSASRSSRSSPIRAVRDHPAFETNHKHLSGGFSKQPFLVPPRPQPPYFLDAKTSSDRQQKPRKVGQINWNRVRS